MKKIKKIIIRILIDIMMIILRQYHCKQHCNQCDDDDDHFDFKWRLLLFSTAVIVSGLQLTFRSEESCLHDT